MFERSNPEISVDSLIKEVVNELANKNYSVRYMKDLTRVFARFSDYAQASNQQFYRPEMSQKFLETFYAERKSQNRPDAQRAANILFDYFNYGKVLRRTKAPEDVWAGALGTYFLDYYEYYKTQGWSKSSLNQTHRHLVAFMRHLENSGVTAIADVETTHLYDLVGTRFAPSTKKDKNHVLRDLRKFLEYLHTQGVATKLFDHAFPHIRVFDESDGIPNVFTKEEVSRLLAAIDRGSPLGKRDYAILLLASRYGLRACDIRELKFENVNWQENTLSLVQSKTGQSLVLPLFDDVGWSIIDYIDNGRPVSPCRCIFIIHNAPYDRFISSLHHLVEKYMRMAKISVRSHTSPGMHAFRHSLASELLRNGVPISAIKEVLGHASIETTSKYQRIDVEQLASCALEVPYAKN